MEIIGIDLGGTNMRVGLVRDGLLGTVASGPVRPKGTQKEIVDDLIALIRQVIQPGCEGIGIGVPSVVDTEAGIVYDVQNIPSWKQVHLKEILQQQFQIPVYVNNDANCFAVGEKHFGKGRDYRHLVGLIIGTGMGAGIIVNDHLYSGANCGAGEFGMIPYRESILEQYGAGQFFQRVYSASGEVIARRAAEGDASALAAFAEMGRHLAEAIKIILYSVDPQLIILGGSVSKSYAFFKEGLWQGLQSFAFSRTLARLKIEVSDLPQVAILGAASLYLDAKKS